MQAEATVQKINRYGSLSAAITTEGLKLLYWKNAPFHDKIVEGGKYTVELEGRPDRDNPSKMDQWIAKCDGVGEKDPNAQQSKGGQQGQYRRPPTSAEIHGPNIALVIKACVEIGNDKATAKEMVDLYIEAVGRVE